MPRPTLSTVKFRTQAALVYGDRYDYRHTKYIHGAEPILVSCRIHGPFLVRASDHLYRGTGCPCCSAEANRPAFLQRSALESVPEYPAAMQDYLAELKVRLSSPGTRQSTDAKLPGWLS